MKQPKYSDAIAVKAVRLGTNNQMASLNIYAWQRDDAKDVISMSPSEVFEQAYADQGQLLDSGTESINGNRVIWMKMKLVSSGLTGFALTYALARDDILFSLHGMTVFGDMTWFEENESDIRESIHTFKFTK